ncbi:hypothetical protein L596_015563 [Steinernema carpocapsae]|uniref:Uncharacterized protein n=1 Tax=Steinernema carpocapsae TaxID=34508 RepID=A0A4U5NFC2_STECR|nr:hypothetical protein L596_015563 [Steinernema carpocapsae]
MFCMRRGRNRSCGERLERDKDLKRALDKTRMQMIAWKERFVIFMESLADVRPFVSLLFSMLRLLFVKHGNVKKRT